MNITKTIKSCIKNHICPFCNKALGLEQDINKYPTFIGESWGCTKCIFYVKKWQNRINGNYTYDATRMFGSNNGILWRVSNKIECHFISNTTSDWFEFSYILPLDISEERFKMLLTFS